MNIKKMENKVKVWLARDKDRELFVYSDIPIRCKNHWGYPTCFYIDKSMFPSIKWEDDEPTEAYITLSAPKEIDWEQRMAEIAESIFVTEQPYINCEEEVEKYAEIAIQRAKILINKLKKENSDA